MSTETDEDKIIRRTMYVSFFILLGFGAYWVVHLFTMGV